MEKETVEAKRSLWRRGLRWLRLTMFYALFVGATLGLGLLLTGLLWTTRPYWLDLVVQWTGAQTAGWLLVLAMLWPLDGRRSWRLLLAPVVLAAGVVSLCVAAYWPRETLPMPKEVVTLRVISYNSFLTDLAADSTFLNWAMSRQPDVLLIIEAVQRKGTYDFLRQYGFEQQLQLGGLVVASRFAVSSVPQLSTRGICQVVEVRPWADTPVICAVVHLKSPRSEAFWKTQLGQSHQLAHELTSAVVATGAPCLVAGDFNSTPLGRGYRSFHATSTLQDCAPSLWRHGTWPSWLPGMASAPIDHVWTTLDTTCTRYEVGPECKSDHRPVFVELTVPKPAASSHSRPVANIADQLPKRP